MTTTAAAYAGNLKQFKVEVGQAIAGGKNYGRTKMTTDTNAIVTALLTDTTTHPKTMATPPAGVKLDPIYAPRQRQVAVHQSSFAGDRQRQGRKPDSLRHARRAEHRARRRARAGQRRYPARLRHRRSRTDARLRLASGRTRRRPTLSPGSGPAWRSQAARRTNMFWSRPTAASRSAALSPRPTPPARPRRRSQTRSYAHDRESFLNATAFR